MKAKKVIDVIQEGVADKAAERMFGILDETDRSEKQASISSEDIIARDGKWALIKNPASISSLGPNIRGVISKDGDIYMENFSEKIHHDILKILFSKGILKGEFSKKWSKQLPAETGFVTVQRYKDTDNICIGESNRLLYDKNDYDKLIPYYSAYINNAKKKNPGLNLQDKLVGMKFADLKENSNIPSKIHQVYEGKHFMANNL
jgi:hypothetical protein